MKSKRSVNNSHVRLPALTSRLVSAEHGTGSCMKSICAPLFAGHRFLAGLTIALLAACATPPAPEPSLPAAAQPSATDLIAAQAVPVAALTSKDPGIAALARAVSGADLVSFQSGSMQGEEDARLKGALTEALVQAGALSTLILDVPCDGAAALDQFTQGAATSQLAAELLANADFPESQKSATLADILTLLRGWNAVNTQVPVRVAGMQCPGAGPDASGRTAVFWGLNELPAHTGEKDVAAAAQKYNEPAANHIWLVQTSDPALSGILPEAGWLDLRVLPDTSDIAAWRQEMAAAVPLLMPGHPSSADILFRHYAPSSATPF